MKIKYILASLSLLCWCSIAFSQPLEVIATLPEFKELVEDIGGNEVIVESLLKGSENAHFLDASPAYTLKVRSADLVCFGGLDLEVGWLPKVLAQSGNPKVQKGSLGYCELGKHITVLGKHHSPV